VPNIVPSGQENEYNGDADIDFESYQYDAMYPSTNPTGSAKPKLRSDGHKAPCKLTDLRYMKVHIQEACIRNDMVAS